MCGIIGYIGKEKKALDVLINGLKHLEYRGYDSAGIAYILDKKITIKKEPGRISNLERIIDFNKKTNIGIGHTRWATHGEANKINSHPHSSGHITVVHNGIIENYLDLKKELISNGYTFLSETDTEVAAALLNDIYNQEKDMLKTIKLFKERVIGSYAMAILCDDDTDSIYIVKKGSPLIIGLGEDSNYIASDILAILDYTNKYIILDDGDYGQIKENKISLYDCNDKLKEKNIHIFDGNSEMVSKQGFEHYMIKEINDEPEVIRKTAQITNLPDINKYKKIVIVGCGSAMHAGMVGSYLMEKYAHIPVQVEIASEFRYKPLFLDKDSLVIAISQSGETADTLEAVKIAKKYGSHTLGIINVFESSIAREVDYVVYTKAGSEVAVATTKAYLAQIEVLTLLTYNSIKNKDIPELSNFLSNLKELPIIIQKLIHDDKICLDIAKKLYQKKDIFFIGRGIDYALCMEASLKLKEISYIHSEAYPAGELKHGTISLIEEGTPVIGIVSDISIADKTISNIKETKARGAYVLYVTTNQLDTEGDFYDDKIVVPAVSKLLQPMVNIVIFQLISYYTAKLKGLDIDKPRNLAKSVTVE